MEEPAPRQNRHQWRHNPKHQSTGGTSLVQDPAASIFPKAPSLDGLMKDVSLSDYFMAAEELKVQGNEKYSAKLYLEAVELYTRAIDLRPYEPTYLTNRAAAYMALNKYGKALSDCRAARSVEATLLPKTLLGCAKCHLGLGDPDSALPLLKKALEGDSGNEQINEFFEIAERMRRGLDNYKRALEDKEWEAASSALDLAGSSSKGYEPVIWRLWKMELDIAVKNWDKASLRAKEILQLDERAPAAQYTQGLVLFLMNDLPSAINPLQEALKLDPRDTKTRRLRGHVQRTQVLKEEGENLFRIGNWRKACRKHLKALEVIGLEDKEGNGGYIRALILSNRAASSLKVLY
ncbi:hypothetical protein FRC02_003442 [Tulasnella sp. 418]|nr:hypothetical protein FRC02_003442 [Tulasnella sp. 418]